MYENLTNLNYIDIIYRKEAFLLKQNCFLNVKNNDF